MQSSTSSAPPSPPVVQIRTKKWTSSPPLGPWTQRHPTSSSSPSKTTRSSDMSSPRGRLEDSEVLGIAPLAVVPVQQGQGIGTQLIGELAAAPKQTAGRCCSSWVILATTSASDSSRRLDWASPTRRSEVQIDTSRRGSSGRTTPRCGVPTRIAGKRLRSQPAQTSRSELRLAGEPRCEDHDWRRGDRSRRRRCRQPSGCVAPRGALLSADGSADRECSSAGLACTSAAC